MDRSPFLELPCVFRADKRQPLQEFHLRRAGIGKVYWPWTLSDMPKSPLRGRLKSWVGGLPKSLSDGHFFVIGPDDHLVTPQHIGAALLKAVLVRGGTGITIPGHRLARVWHHGKDQEWNDWFTVQDFIRLTHLLVIDRLPKVEDWEKGVIEEILQERADNFRQVAILSNDDTSAVTGRIGETTLRPIMQQLVYVDIREIL